MLIYYIKRSLFVVFNTENSMGLAQVCIDFIIWLLLIKKSLLSSFCAERENKKEAS